MPHVLHDLSNHIILMDAIIPCIKSPTVNQYKPALMPLKNFTYIPVYKQTKNNVYILRCYYFWFLSWLLYFLMDGNA